MEECDAEILAAEDFRRRMGFLGVMGIAFTGQVYLMTALRPVLEPFLFALFVVMGLHPLARSFESLILCIGRVVCGCGSDLGGTGRRHRRKRRCRGGCPPSDDRDQEIELSSSADGVYGDDSEHVDEHIWRVTESHDVCSDCCACIARIASVTFALLVILGGLCGFTMLVFHAAVQVKENFATYEEGARNAVQNIKMVIARVFGKMPRSVVDEISENTLAGAKALVSDLLGGLLSHAGKLMVELLMLALYVMFWLCTPMPLDTKTERIFRRYLFLKGGACIFYGISVGVMLFLLNVHLCLFFGLMSFFFSFIPEVGAFIGMVLPVPVILFDSKLQSPFLTLLMATAGQLGLKFLFANIIEVKLVEHDAIMKMHPVVTLLALSFFGFIWGPTGMLLSVPLMAYVKVLILSDIVPSSYRDPILILIEGDRQAPERHGRRAIAARQSPLPRE